MLSTNIVVSLDTRRARQDGTFPLVLRLGHLDRTISIPLGIHLKEKDWNEEDRLVRKSYGETASVQRLNNLIQKKKAEALDMIVKLRDAGEIATMSAKTLKDKLIRQDKQASFFRYAEGLIKGMRVAKRFGTARTYEGAVSILKTFNKGRPFDKRKGGSRKPEANTWNGKVQDLKFSEINYRYLNNLENYHLGCGNQLNGLSVYMRAIRSIFNKAVKDGVVGKESYPFSDYKIKGTPTKKRALSPELLGKIIEAELQGDDPCFDARNYFLASYMMYGMNFSDMALLKRSDMNNGRIVYSRKKTSKIYDIKVTDGLDRILSYYISQKPESEYIFPIIKRTDSASQERDIYWARKRYNAKLKELARRCGIESALTSYVSRHSFATHAMFQSVPVTAISTMLGHSSLKTTEIYLKGLPSDMLDKYNDQIMTGLMGKEKPQP